MEIRQTLLDAAAEVLRHNGIEPNDPTFRRKDVQEAATLLLERKGVPRDAAVATVITLAAAC